MEISVRSYLTAGMALTAASAIAFTPVVIPNALPRDVALPHVSTPNIQLTAVINEADITALINNLHSALDSVSSTVTPLAGAPGQTLVGALDSAVALNNTLWDGLITATNNRVLVDVLTALKAASGGGLSKLAASVDSANDTVILTTGEVTNLLTSTLTGSLGTALHAVSTVINNPLAVSSYAGLINVPLNIAGLAFNTGVAATRDLGVNALTLGNTLVTGVTAQVTNVLSTVNDLLDAAKGVSDVDLVDGVLTAVQGIVSAPVTVAVAGIDGLTGALTRASSIAVTKLANGAGEAVTTWLGNGTTPGALQNAINTIGAAPLSPASYTNAISALVGAGVATVNTAIGTARSFASLPFSSAANLTTTAANMITALSSSVATTAAGIMQAAGLPSLVYNLPHVLAAGVNTAVNVAAFATSTTLNGIASVIDIGNAITGVPGPQALTVSASSDSASLTADANSPELARDTESAADTPASSEAQTAGTKKPATNETTPVEAETEGIEALAEEAKPVEETAVRAAEDAANATPEGTAVPEKPEVPKTTVTKRVTTADSTTAEDTTTATNGASATIDATTSDEPKKKADEPKATAPATRTQPINEKDPDKKDESKKPGDDTVSRGAAAGGRHARDTVKNGVSVNEIKSKLDKETTPAHPSAASTAPAAAA